MLYTDTFVYSISYMTTCLAGIILIVSTLLLYPLTTDPNKFLNNSRAYPHKV
jgi:hypothetical protein